MPSQVCGVRVAVVCAGGAWHSFSRESSDDMHRWQYQITHNPGSPSSQELGCMLAAVTQSFKLQRVEVEMPASRMDAWVS